METDQKQQKTVFVGLSGGVDSSVAALRLIKAGYKVVGVFIKVWQPEFIKCNWEQERLDAMRVAAHLKIPFLTCDAENSYKRDVADYFIKEYQSGRTPNPDVMCNQYVKFGRFLEYARENGADYIATGHYARNIPTIDPDTKQTVFELYRGKDTNKDQSYFLWTLTQKQLSQSLFPVGDTSKANIRKEAARAGLPVATKQDSQGICFLGHIDIPEFLSHFVDLKTGAVLDKEGNKIGLHKGALVYTLGQRHGFSVTTPNTDKKPMYVIDRNLDTNTITVDSSKPAASANNNLLKLSATNWIPSPVKNDQIVDLQIRYRQTPITTKIKEISYINDKATIELPADAEKAAPGQSAVLYTGEKCLGGGIIE